jgi:K(+)-stimulated pyrophosphate-energized sodium pump
MDIPEDDPRNPAVIADNVGDNVGDVAGMGADLFESFVGSIVAAITLANGDVALVILPLWISGGGILASMMGYFVVGTKDKATQRELVYALHKGTIVSSIFVTLFSAISCWILFHSNPTIWSVSLRCIYSLYFVSAQHAYRSYHKAGEYLVVS